MNQVYIFSGLGADERAFHFIRLDDYNVNFIKWILPGNNESIECYAERLATQITAPDPIFIGLSFGGMIAIEVAKIIKPIQLILIASAKGKQEIPFYYKLAGRFKIHKLLPVTFLTMPSMITNWFFGILNQEDKQLLAAILRETDKQFLKWAIDKIVNWRNKVLPANCTHIHGTSDRILPYGFVKADVTIYGGGHFMTVNKAAALNKILFELLENTN